jgi:hypothetical protein
MSRKKRAKKPRVQEEATADSDIKNIPWKSDKNQIRIVLRAPSITNSDERSISNDKRREKESKKREDEN